ncbi:MAG: acetate/propionate family kinase [Hyphomicrobiales bacterium]|nr:MAG: acetate/propionate family kinase [Hyphomicrobiales bacterium]
MKILVSNIGSTSFKFRLFDMSSAELELASGGADRIGGSGGALKLALGGRTARLERDFADHGQAIEFVMSRLVAEGALSDAADLDAVAFKAVVGGGAEPVCMVDDALLDRMEYFVPIAPVHNPPYIAAMRMFRQILPGAALVAAFEAGFHATNPPRRRVYACPPDWTEKFGVRRYGYHGASHRYIASRLGELMPEARRVISCHLGGSSSLCAIADGMSVATSMGLTPQSGLPQGTRVGDFDAFGLKLMAAKTGRDMDDLLGELGSRAGLAALSGTSGDIRDIEAGLAGGDERCRLALDLYATSIRDYLGAYMLELGGVDAIAFTGGIGQHSPRVRDMVLCELDFAGIVLDAKANKEVHEEGRIDATDSATALWVLPANEELVVARLAAEFLAKQRN